MAQLITTFERLRSPQFLNYIFTCLGLVLLLMAAWLLAQLTWRVVVPVEQIQLAPLSSIKASPMDVAGVDIHRVQALHLFGEKGAETSQLRSEDAPVTSLNIRLVGVTASNNPNLSAAIIQQGAEQSTYIPGDTVSNSRAVVKEIRSDRVMLENSSRLETLWLEGRDGKEVPLVLQTQPTATKAANEDSEPEVRLNTQQKEILQLISITPQQGENGLAGYRLAPKGDEALFRQFGLRAGDLAVAINGYDLTNMAESLELLSQLEGLTQAQVRVLRDGEYVDIEIYIPEE